LNVQDDIDFLLPDPRPDKLAGLEFNPLLMRLIFGDLTRDRPI
jgi:hypothetical protein